MSYGEHNDTLSIQEQNKKQETIRTSFDAVILSTHLFYQIKIKRSRKSETCFYQISCAVDGSSKKQIWHLFRDPTFGVLNGEDLFVLYFTFTREVFTQKAKTFSDLHSIILA